MVVLKYYSSKALLNVLKSIHRDRGKKETDSTLDITLTDSNSCNFCKEHRDGNVKLLTQQKSSSPN